MSSSSNSSTAEPARLVVRRAVPADAAAISALLEATSAEHILPGFSAAGQAYYRAQLAPAEIAAKLALGDVYRFHVALRDGVLAGVAATRGDSHLYYLFTASAHHRQGVARALWHAVCRAARDAGQFGPITVNAALGAVAAYQRLGFEAEGPSEEVRGIRFVPMICRHPAPAPDHAAPVA